MSAAGPQRCLLLVQPQFLLRRTVAAVARELGLAQVLEAATLEGALRVAQGQRIDGLLIDLDEADEGIAVLSGLREGRGPWSQDLPVVALLSHCDPGRAMTLKELAVRRVLLKPFTVRQVLQTVEMLWPASAQPCAPWSAAGTSGHAVAAP